MSELASYAGRLADGTAVTLAVRDGRIEARTPLADCADLPWLLPPLVDVQQNGALGINFHALGEPGNEEAIYRIAHFLRCHGVGRCWLTIPSAPLLDVHRAYRTIGSVLDRDADLAALFCGIFHEGIFISPREGWRGAHPPHCILPPDYEMIRRFDEACGGRIRLVNAAPEEPGGLEFVSRAVADGKRVTLGHCCPDAATIGEAIARGARWVTHFGNGAATMIHRFRNPFWSYLERAELGCMVIADGFHLPPEVIRTALLCKGRAGCLPVSDASGYSGCPPGHYQHANYHDFVIEPSGLLHLAGSETLMGAWFQLDRGVEFFVQQLGYSLPEAWLQCSAVVAQAMGIGLPALAVGEEASFVVARWAGDGLQLVQSVHRGAPLLRRPLGTRDLVTP